jgi:hypothetical protein
MERGGGKEGLECVEYVVAVSLQNVSWFATILEEMTHVTRGQPPLDDARNVS